MVKILWMGHKIIEENAYKFCFIKLKILTEQKPVKRKGFFLILFTTGINVKKKKKSPKVSLRNLSCIYFIKKIVSKTYLIPRNIVLHVEMRKDLNLGSI